VKPRFAKGVYYTSKVDFVFSRSAKLRSARLFRASHPYGVRFRSKKENFTEKLIFEFFLP